MFQIKFAKIKIFIKKLPRFLGENVFIFLLVSIFLELILGGLLFYKYSVLAEKAKVEVTEETIRFEQETYQKVLDAWIEQRKKFNEAAVKEYPDLFQPKGTSTPL